MNSEKITERKKSVNPNSLANLTKKEWLDESKTVTIRVPENLKSIILEIAHSIDNQRNEKIILPDEKLGIIPIDKVYTKLNAMYTDKKSMKETIKKLDQFFTTHIPRLETSPKLNIPL